MNPIFIRAAQAGAFGVASVMGSPISLTLKDDREFTVTGIFRPRSERVIVGDGGVEMIVKVPQLSLQRVSLLRAGLSDADMEKEIRGASFEMNGRAYVCEDVEDDEIMWLQVWPKLKTQQNQRYVNKYAPPAG